MKRSFSQMSVGIIATVLVLCGLVSCLVWLINQHRYKENMAEAKELMVVPMKVNNLEYDSLIILNNPRKTSYDKIAYPVKLVNVTHPTLGKAEVAYLDVFFYDDGGDYLSYTYLVIYDPDGWDGKTRL